MRNHRSKNHQTTITAVLILFLLVAGQAIAAQPLSPSSDPPPKTDSPRMVFVLDASGSMWGQIDGKPKIAIAKEVMAGLIDEIPADFHTGLIVYGHRRKGDCDDIEMVIPVGPHNPAAMKASVAAINPKGKTPLSEAVRQAAMALRHVEERATVVLVSDGLETCNVDPCELAAELAKTGVDFTIHVIGFDISEEEQGRLRCMADKTGGLFLAADNAGSLREALLTTVEKVKEPPPPVVEDPGKATLDAPDSVPVGSVFQIAWEGPDSLGDNIAIAPKKPEDAHTIDNVYTKTGNPVDFVAPGKKGDYELRYIHGHTQKVIGRRDIAITPIPATVKAPEAVDVATEFDVEWTGPAYKSDYVCVARTDQKPGSYLNYKYTRDGSPLKLRAPSDPGTYEIRYVLGRGNEILATTAIDVMAVVASVQAPESADVATQFEVAWTGPGNKDDYISIARTDQESGAYINYTHTRDGSPLKLQAPSDPGTYEIRYILGIGNKLLAKTTIAINAVTAQVAGPPAADVATQFEVTWTGPGNKDDYISIARTDQESGAYINYTHTRDGSPLKLQAPSDPGTYEIRYMLGKGNKILAKTTITINAVTAQVAAPPAADVATQFEVTWTGPGNKDDYISIARTDQESGAYVNYTYTRDGSPLKLKAPSEPGTYEVRYILGKGNKILAKTTITINAVTAQVQAPPSADAGSEFEVTWTGPGYKSDYISVARLDQSPGAYVHYTYISAGSPLKLRAPYDPDTYEVRYIMTPGNKLLAKTTITINAVTAQVQAPASAGAETKISVTWTGPNYKGDYISIALPDQNPGSYKTYTYTGNGNPLEVKTPKEPGTYEVRYILGQGKKILGKTTITIQ